jgi:hypothetical protein
MGTGLLAALNRTGSITPLISAINRVKSIIRDGIQDDNGVLCSVSHLNDTQKLNLASRLNYRRRAEIALDVTSHYPGGDYFEFGSAGLATFRSFLAAFDINHAVTKHFSSARFYAFDIFGNPDQGSGPPPSERDYFEHWRAPPELAAPVSLLEPYGALKDRCILVPGYYQDTLNEDFKAKMRAEYRRIGFAFLDCGTASSYKVVLDFLLEVIGGAEKMFIYLDEYFTDPSVPQLYQIFTVAARERYGLQSIYMRNAGNFGALFCLLPPPWSEYDHLFTPDQIRSWRR